MAFSTVSKTSCIARVIAALLLISIGSVTGDIQAVNQCSFDLTVFKQDPANGLSQFPFPAGSSLPLNVGNPWVGGVIWASPHGNTNNGEATQLEFNINPPNMPGRDFYDVSVVNAYNLPAMINPTFLANGDERSGLECATVYCTMSSSELNYVCQPPNNYAGPDNACINVNGPAISDNPSIDWFGNVCPLAYAHSNNNTNVVYGCATGSNYDVIWCP